MKDGLKMIKHRFLVRIVANIYVWYHGSHPKLNKFIQNIPKIIAGFCDLILLEVFAFEFGSAEMEFFSKPLIKIPNLPYILLGNLTVIIFIILIFGILYISYHFKNIIRESTRRCRVNIHDAILQKKLKE